MKSLFISLSILFALSVALPTGTLTPVSIPDQFDQFSATSDLSTIVGVDDGSAVIYSVNSNSTTVFANASAAIISADGNWMAVTDGLNTSIYLKAATWEKINTVYTGPNPILQFSADTTRLAIIDNTTIYFFSRGSGKIFSLVMRYNVGDQASVGQVGFDDTLQTAVFVDKIIGLVAVSVDYTTNKFIETVIDASVQLRELDYRVIVNGQGTAISIIRDIYIKSTDAKWNKYTLRYDYEDFDVQPYGTSFSADGNILYIMGGSSIYRYMLTAVKGDRIPYDRTQSYGRWNSVVQAVVNKDNTKIIFSTFTTRRRSISYIFTYDAKPYGNGTLCNSSQDCIKGDDCGSGNLCYTKGVRSTVHSFRLYTPYVNQVYVNWEIFKTPNYITCELAGSISPGTRDNDENLQYGYNNTLVQVAAATAAGIPVGPFYNVTYVGPQQGAIVDLKKMNLNSEKVVVRLTVICQDAYANSQPEDHVFTQYLPTSTTAAEVTKQKHNSGADMHVPSMLKVLSFTILILYI